MPYDQRCAISKHTQICAQTIRRISWETRSSTATEQADARVCLAWRWLACVASSRFFSSRVLLLCQDVLYWDSSQSQRGRPSSEGEGEVRFQDRGDWARRSRPVAGDHQGGTRDGESDPSACCLPDPHRAQCRNDRAAGMHRSRRDVGREALCCSPGKLALANRGWWRNCNGPPAAHDFQLLGGQCFPTDRSCPYAPLLDLLRAFLAPLSPAQIATALGSSARALFPLLPEQVQHLPELASLPPLSPLDPEQEKRRLFAPLADVFMRASDLPTGPAGDRRYPLER